MWVEIVGLPGVGKSTMIERQLGAFRRHFEVIESRTPSVIHRVIARFWYHIYFATRLNDKCLAKKLAYRMSFRTMLMRKKPVLFYDSGLLQAVLENLIDTDFADLEHKIRVLRHLHLPDRIVYVEDDPNMVSKREIGRAVRRFLVDSKTLTDRYRTAKDILESRMLSLIGLIYKVKSGSEINIAELIQ
ncbi:MAG: hypothetical protein WC547_07795 [Candidatus Omnitrophota bacterium]